MALPDPRWKLLLRLSVLAGICLYFAAAASAQETGIPSTLKLTEKLLRKAEVERKIADKSRWRVYEQGNPIPRTKAEIPEPPPKPLPPPPTPEAQGLDQDGASIPLAPNHADRSRQTATAVLTGGE